jgi:hypothetical protein
VIVIQTFLSEIIGGLMVSAAFAWAGFDASQHAGRASMTTIFCALVIASVGGFLISKHKMAEIADFLFAQATRARSFKFPSAGSDSSQ